MAMENKGLVLFIVGGGQRLEQLGGMHRCSDPAKHLSSPSEWKGDEDGKPTVSKPTRVR